MKELVGDKKWSELINFFSHNCEVEVFINDANVNHMQVKMFSYEKMWRLLCEDNEHERVSEKEMNILMLIWNKRKRCIGWN